jgi:GT2 family glycosyltransferase
MKVLICGLVYGGRPHNVIFQNLLKSGYPAEYILIDREGIAAALNDGIDAMLDGGFDYVGFLANDIQEPEDWLLSKINVMSFVKDAGAVSIDIQRNHTSLISQHIIGNYLISREAINKIGYFNEEFDPYGPIDLDYCERLHAAGFGTYYALNEMASHPHSHAAGTEYGYNKAERVAQLWAKHVQNSYEYKAGIKPLRLERLERIDYDVPLIEQKQFWEG